MNGWDSCSTGKAQPVRQALSPTAAQRQDALYPKRLHRRRQLRLALGGGALIFFFFFFFFPPRPSQILCAKHKAKWIKAKEQIILTGPDRHSKKPGWLAPSAIKQPGLDHSVLYVRMAAVLSRTWPWHGLDGRFPRLVDKSWHAVRCLVLDGLAEHMG